MFSYTDDAIVTSSPTGRHLSTVIRRPAAIGPLDWSEHADEVCKVLNELGSKAKAHSLSLHLQTVGRAKRDAQLDEAILSCYPDGPTAASIRAELKSAEPNPWSLPVSAHARIAELEKQLDDATTKLCAAQMLLEQSDRRIATLERRIADYQNAATNRGN